MRTAKQLCETAQPVAYVNGLFVLPAGAQAPGSIGDNTAALNFNQAYTSQSCQATSLYSASAFQVPYGPALPFVCRGLQAGALGTPRFQSLCGNDPVHQSSGYSIRCSADVQSEERYARIQCRLYHQPGADPLHRRPDIIRIFCGPAKTTIVSTRHRAYLMALRSPGLLAVKFRAYMPILHPILAIPVGTYFVIRNWAARTGLSHKICLTSTLGNSVRRSVWLRISADRSISAWAEIIFTTKRKRITTSSLMRLLRLRWNQI